METNRQKKIAGVIQKDLVEIFQKIARDSYKGLVVSVTKVQVTTDLSLAKAYLSVFPTNHKTSFFEYIDKHHSAIKNDLAQRTKHQLRRVPDITFYDDDSLDYIDNIEAALRGKDDDPIKNPEASNKKKS